MTEYYDSETVAAFAVASAEGLGPAAFCRIQEVNAASGRGFIEFLRLDRRRMMGEYRLTPAQIKAIAESAPPDAIAKLLHEARRAGMRLILRGAPDYPARLLETLAASAPSFLFMQGSAQLFARGSAERFARGPAPLLADHCIAVIGTRNPTRWGLAGARALGQACAREGWSVVSGFAPGVDQAAHCAAVEAGGRTILVLCYGMRRYHPLKAIADAEQEGRAAVISQFPLEQEFSTRTAMARNRVVAALAGRVVVVESQRRGGAMETARMARELRRPLFALSADSKRPTPEGNQLLIEQGALPLIAGMKNNRVFIECDTLFSHETPPPVAGQLELI
ncbi:MAG: DNA-processing protein DprA [Candidatus Sumerlaeota bacterium]|nr:DNA-processing protein DprA [Candidatus Sumerlaeota bacterium]